MLDFIDAFCERFPKNIDTLETLLTDNRIGNSVPSASALSLLSAPCKKALPA